MDTETRRAKVNAELRAEIARQNVRLADVATAAGMTVKTLKRRLDGGKTFDITELAAVCSFLNIPLVEFISRTEPSK